VLSIICFEKQIYSSDVTRRLASQEIPSRLSNPKDYSGIHSSLLWSLSWPKHEVQIIWYVQITTNLNTQLSVNSIYSQLLTLKGKESAPCPNILAIAKNSFTSEALRSTSNFTWWHVASPQSHRPSPSAQLPSWKASKLLYDAAYTITRSYRPYLDAGIAQSLLWLDWVLDNRESCSISDRLIKISLFCNATRLFLRPIKILTGAGVSFLGGKAATA